MKKLLFLSMAILLVTVACNNSAASVKDSSASSTGAGSGKGTITCLINGKQKTFILQEGFTEVKLDPYTTGPKDGILITDGGAKKEGFQFEIKKSGTSIIKTGSGLLCVINYYNPEGLTYTGSDVTVTVSSYDQRQLTGTFSGKLVNIFYKGASDKNPEFIEVTDGKFDLHN